MASMRWRAAMEVAGQSAMLNPGSAKSGSTLSDSVVSSGPPAGCANNVSVVHGVCSHLADLEKGVGECNEMRFIFQAQYVTD